MCGSLLDPAEQADVLGVGGLAPDELQRIARGLPTRLAPFSAREPTAWEAAHGSDKIGILRVGADGSCAPNTGTSFAYPGI
ncbi:hypothetical protein T492DRAFT_864712 [Pavlovales sp. CCMP2436]|nr:hypothetical protein T492DRAFT_864712 [Pavlovales sp. CCMP2436]